MIRIRKRTTFARRPIYRTRAYLLLETVIAVGMLVLGLTIIGGQIQTSNQAAQKMEMRMRAMALAEMQLAHLDTGLIEVDSIDEVEEEDFGPRFKDFGWRLITEETATEELFRLTLEILYQPREDYDELFDYDEAEVLYRFFVFRAAPKPINFSEDLGMNEEQFDELAEKLDLIGVEGISAEEFDPSIFAKLEAEELLEVMPLVASAFGIDISTLLSQLPPEMLEALQNSDALQGLEGIEGLEGLTGGDGS